MKIIEGIQLKNTIKQIRKYQSEHKGFDNLYRELDSLNINSLQSFSFQNDSDFFDEVSFVLSVINSIIAHPHIITKSEDIVILPLLERLGRAFSEITFTKTQKYGDKMKYL